MTRFLDEIIVRPMPNGKDWEVQNEIKYATATSKVIYVAAGFITDFASIPKLFRIMFSPATGKHRRAALVHDWIYRTDDCKYTRKEADMIFLEIMELDDVGWFTKTMLYRAVRMGGGFSYVERTV